MPAGTHATTAPGAAGPGGKGPPPKKGDGSAQASLEGHRATSRAIYSPAIIRHGAGCQRCGGHCRGGQWGGGSQHPLSQPRAGDSTGSHTAVPWGGNHICGVLPSSLTSSRGDTCGGTRGGCPSWGRARGCRYPYGAVPTVPSPQPRTPQCSAPRAGPQRGPRHLGGDFLPHKCQILMCPMGGHEFGSGQKASPAAVVPPPPRRCRAVGTQPRCPRGGQVPSRRQEGTTLHPSAMVGPSP